eukprot:m.468141 g.468141  ORF g.468141 m.468141 type:complete len:486 (+) comp57070_c0_seq15:800-2257(+)
MLKYLLSVEELAGLIDAPDDDELTAFGRAVERGCMKFVKVLLKADADVHAAVSEEMGTVLHLAVERAQTEVLAYLLDLNLFDEVIDEKNAEGDTALMLAVRMGNIKCFDLLQSAGASLSARSETMGTVLHVACDVEHVEMLTHLLQFAAIRSEINTTDEFKGTVLHFAATSKPEILQLILNTDAACINSQNNVGYVPLMRALKSGSKANVEALVKAGTDLSLRDRDGLTCLHHAASRGKPEMLRVLLQANSSNINAQDRRGATALMLACYLAHAIELGEGRKMIIKLLLEAGADIFLQNKDGETAKDVLGQDRPEILRIFQEHEEYLSKIGSRTKPALRAVAPAAASQDPAEAVPLGLMLPSDLPIADDHGQSTVGDTSQGIEGQPADDSTHAVAVAGDAAEFVEAAEPMEDSEQESTEQTQDTIRWPRAPALQLDLSDLGTELGIEATSPLHTDAAANSPTATSQEQSNDAAEFVGKRRRRDVE